MDEPLSELAASAAQIHECYMEFQRAGFTEEQALYLVGRIVNPGKN